MIKSKELLSSKEEEPEPPIVRKLQLYKQIKIAAKNLANMPRKGRDVFVAKVALHNEMPKPEPEVELDEIVAAMLSFKYRVRLNFITEKISVLDKKYKLLQCSYLNPGKAISFTKKEGKAGVVASFLAILDFVKEGVCEVEASRNKLQLKF